MTGLPPLLVRNLAVGGGVLACVGLAVACYVAPSAAASGLAVLGVGAPLVWLIWHRPELGVFGLLCLTAGLLRGAELYVPLPLGGLYPNDLVLFGLFGLFGLRGLVRDGLRMEWWPVSKPLLVFLGLAVASVVYAVGFREVDLNRALNELRALAYYAASIVTAMALSRPTHRSTLLIGLFVLADVITSALILQQFAGAGRLLLPGMVDWQVDQVGTAGVTDEPRTSTGTTFGLVRIVPPAHLLLFFLMILSFVWALASGPRRPVRAMLVAQCVFLNVGLVLTYTRAQWIASVVSLGVIGLLLPRTFKIRLAGGLMAAFVLALLGVGLLEAGVRLPGADQPAVAAIASRATSALSPEQTLRSASLQWRAFEIEEALRSLVESPQGTGLGNAYRAITTYAGEAAGYQGKEPLNRFLHNSYLYIGVKTGVLGLAAFLWFCLAFLTNGWRLFQRLPDGPDRWLVLALLASFVGILQWSFTEANLMHTGSTVVVGLMVGIAASLARAPTVADARAYRAAE